MKYEIKNETVFTLLCLSLNQKNRRHVYYFTIPIYFSNLDEQSQQCGLIGMCTLKNTKSKLLGSLGRRQVIDF